jgi:hypothetical protein
MNCRMFHRNLEDYLEGGLDFSGRFGMERHAGECIRCGKELADARNLSRLAAGLVRVRAPEGFEEALCGRIAARKSRGFLPRLRRFGTYGFALPSPGALALAACSAVVLGFGAFYALGPDALEPGSARRMETAGREVQRAEPIRAEQAQAEPAPSLPARTEAVEVAVVPAVERESPEALPEPAAVAEPVAEAPVSVAASNSTPSPRTPEARFQWNRQDYGMEVVDYLLVGPESYALPDRLPKKLYVKYGQPSEEYFIRNVSH